MDQAEFELQLKVWKDMAISKQVLMRAATDALGLDPDCSTEELKVTLDAAIKKVIDADANVKEANERAAVAVSEMEKKVKQAEKAQAIAENEMSKANETLESAQHEIEVERASHIKDVAKAKEQVAATEETLKNINRALADTPENVLKKLKTLKKQKGDEANARKAVEATVTTLRKEKRELEQKVADGKTALESSVKMVEQHRELHKLCEDMKAQLKPLVEDAKDLPAVPALDESTLEAVEKAGASEDDK